MAGQLTRLCRTRAPRGASPPSRAAAQVVREFGLTLDIETLIREVDTDKSGFIDYEEFKQMMGK